MYTRFGKRGAKSVTLPNGFRIEHDLFQKVSETYKNLMGGFGDSPVDKKRLEHQVRSMFSRDRFIEVMSYERIQIEKPGQSKFIGAAITLNQDCPTVKEMTEEKYKLLDAAVDHLTEEQAQELWIEKSVVIPLSMYSMRVLELDAKTKVKIRLSYLRMEGLDT